MVSPNPSKTKTHPPGYISQAQSLRKLQSLSNNLNELNPSRGAKDNHMKRLSFPPPLYICQSAARGESGKQLCCRNPVGRDGGPDGWGITSATARGELGTAMPTAPSLLAHVQVRGGTPRRSCFDSVSGLHPALLRRGLRHAQLFRGGGSAAGC